MQNFGRLRLILFIGFLCLAGSLTNYAQLADTAVAPTINACADSSQLTIFIADIAITGYKKTKPYIIQREIPFKKGDSMLRSELPKWVELCRQQVMNTSLFVEVEVKAQYITTDIVLINVHVNERWYLFPLPYFEMIDRNFNTWWVDHKHSLERINYGLTFTHNNLSGRNDKLNVSLITGYTQKIALRYENPFLDKSLMHGMNVGFSYSLNHEVNYATNLNKQSFIKQDDEYLIKQFHIDLGYSYRPAVKTRHNFRIGYSDLQISDTVIKLNPNFSSTAARRIRFPDFNYSIQYFNVDYIPYPLRGFAGDAHFYKRFGKEDNVWEIGGKGTYTKKVLPTSYLQFQASGVIRFPYKQPYYNIKMFGTSDLYMRGLEYYVIDGVAGGMVRATAIQQLIQFKISNPINIKTIDKIPFRFMVKAFSDLGYSYNPHPGNSTLNNKLLGTWGIGLDVITIYDIVFRLEYSFNQLGEKGLFIHTKSDF